MARSTPDRASFIRRTVLRNPKITLEELKESAEKAGVPNAKKLNVHDIHLARSSIKKKYGLQSADDVPIKPDGDLNVSELLRRLLRKRPTTTEKQARHYLRVEGLDFTQSLFIQIKNALQKPKVVPAEEESVDPNQNKGPRARLKRRKKRTVKKTHGKLKLTAEQRRLGDAYLSMEDRLDVLMQDARNLENSVLVEQIRQVRRTVILEVCEIAESAK